MYQEHYNHYEDFIKTLSRLESPLDKRFIEIMDEHFKKIRRKNTIQKLNEAVLDRLISKILVGKLGRG